MPATILEMPGKTKRLTVHLLRDYKTKSLFEKLLVIHDASFEGVQRPPEALLKQMYLQSDVVVTYVDDVPVGFAIVLDRASQPYLWTIAVSPEYRGQGVGKTLLQEVAYLAQNQKRDFIELTCTVDNPAQKLYFDNGYRVTGVARGYYGVEGDGLMMRKDIGGNHGN